ncbi:MAG: NAD-dependent succinate-semialdehyde dehydrogenase [Rhizobiaceae bacterium]|nr:NAD-dependent succinate-semialdehyde dehydrogenase [Rhizobiaceae bacterium]
MYPQPQIFIGGSERETREYGSDIIMNPATGVQIATLPIADADDVEAAIAAAEAAFPGWSETAPVQRARVLADTANLIRQHSDELARMLTLENGKPLAEARGEVGAAADVFDWFSGEARRAYGRIIPSAVNTRMLAMKEPVGVVATLSPWNFPIVTAVKKIAPALAAGCTVISVPAKETPGAVLAIARYLHEAGLLAGALNVITGRPRDIVSRLMAAPQVSKLSFTGSTPVGRQLARQAADGLKRLTMELGGHAPVIVMDDVDVERALDLSVTAKLRNAGQVCTSATRFYVHKKVYDDFVTGFARRAAEIRVGDGMDAGTQMGPLSNKRRPAAMQRLVDDAVSCGARLAAGGSDIEGQGYFFQPTVLADVPANAAAMQEEPFGPLALVAPFSDIDEAINAANSVPYGLAAYALTDNARSSHRIAKGLRSGVVGINTFQASSAETPFGGIRDSGYGVEGGIEGMDSYLVTKFVHEH